jgi:hypothetical protein
MATQEISDYVNGLSSATLVGTEELYLDTDEKATINEVGEFLNGRIWKAQIEQTGTSAPVLTVLVNTLGVTVTTSYVGVGTFLLSGFDSNLTGDTAIECVENTAIGSVSRSLATSSSINIFSAIFSAGAFNLANDVLTTAQKINQIITVTKYD